MASAGPFQSRPQAQKTTPNATPRTDATTMSMVRQRRLGATPCGRVAVSMVYLPARVNQEEHTPRTGVPVHGALREVTELPALALPRSGSRVCGSVPHSQRFALPCRMLLSCPPTLAPHEP